MADELLAERTSIFPLSLLQIKHHPSSNRRESPLQPNAVYNIYYHQLLCRQDAAGERWALNSPLEGLPHGSLPVRSPLSEQVQLLTTNTPSIAPSIRDRLPAPTPRSHCISRVALASSNTPLLIRKRTPCRQSTGSTQS